MLKKYLPGIIFCIQLLFLLNPHKVFSQQSNAMFLQHLVPQSSILNPAVQIDCKYFIGFPVLNDISIDYHNTSFSYNDLVNGDSLNLDQVHSQLKSHNFITFQTDIYLLSFGYRSKKNYFSFHIADKTAAYVSFPGNLVGLALYGNEQFLGKNEKFRNLRVNANYYREYGFGYSTFLDYLTMIGVRAKILFGKANVHTGKSRINLYGNETSFALETSGEMKLNSSYPLSVVQNNDGTINNILFDYPDYTSLLLNRKNPGIAFDAGIIKRYSKRLNISASIIDLGFIRWADKVNKLEAESAFEFSGVATGANFSTRNFLEEMRDSLIESSEISISNRPYYTGLPLKTYFGADYQWTKHIRLGLINRNLVVNRRLHPTLTFSASTVLFNYLVTNANWTLGDNSFNQLGGGIALIGNGFQFHIFSDNILGFFKPFDARYLNLQFGFNILAGCPRSDREARLYNSLYGRIPGGNCSWSEQSRQKNKYLKKVSRKRKY